MGTCPNFQTGHRGVHRTSDISTRYALRILAVISGMYDNTKTTEILDFVVHLYCGSDNLNASYPRHCERVYVGVRVFGLYQLCKLDLVSPLFFFILSSFSSSICQHGSFHLFCWCDIARRYDNDVNSKTPQQKLLGITLRRRDTA